MQTILAYRWLARSSGIHQVKTYHPATGESEWRACDPNSIPGNLYNQCHRYPDTSVVTMEGKKYWGGEQQEVPR